MMRAAVLALLALVPALAAGALAAGGAPAPAGDPRQGDLRQAYRRPADIPFPPGNPYSDAKRALGERLFFEPLLSAGNTMSCASCHKPEHGFSDGRPLAVGETGAVGTHHTPTLYNLAWAGSLFWDGRAPSLEAQAVGPMANPVEMAQDLAVLPAELEAAPGYAGQFAGAFPEDPRITNDNIAKAIATYERTLVTPPAPFDRWVEGDEGAIDAAAKRGFALFNGKAGCANCHSGWDFTDGGFYDTGLPATGAGRSAVVPQPRLANAWKTPTLRNLTGRGPFMHDGSLPTVEAVIDHYADTVVLRATLPRELPRRIALNKAERADLVAFLRTLDSGNPAAVRVAVAPPPPAEAAPAPPSRQVEVTQKNTAFSQKAVRLLPGGKLVIHNEDTRSHNIRVYAPEMDYDSGIQDPGQSVEVAFDKAGTYHAVCNIHPKMKMEVEVGR